MAYPDLQRLAALVKTRRLELGLARNATAEGFGMSKHTWKRVEDGEPIRELNYAKIEQALLWATGSCVRILRGGEPIEVQHSRSSRAEFAEVPADVIEEKLRTSIQGAMVTGTDLSVESIRLATELAIKAMREHGLLSDVDE
jgi:hypothetical protein